MGNNVLLKKIKNYCEISNSNAKDFLAELETKEPEFFIDQESNKYIFFWLTNENHDLVDKNNQDKLIWSPFDEEDCLFLENWYRKFLKGEKTLLRLGDYVIDYRVMLQYHHKYTSIQRPIIRILENEVKNIYRKNRYDDSMIKFNPINIKSVKKNFHDKSVDNVKSNVYEICDQYEEIVFEVISQIRFKIPKDYYDMLSKSDLKDSYYNHINKLKGEINNLSNKLKKFDVYNLKYLVSMKEDQFFQSMIRMYTDEGFLYKIINNILRENNSYLFKEIKYFYLSLLASYKYYSQNSVNTLLNESKIPNTIKEPTIYRGCNIPKEDFEHFEYLNTHSPMLKFEFFSISVDKKLEKPLAENCMISLELVLDTSGNQFSEVSYQYRSEKNEIKYHKFYYLNCKRLNSNLKEFFILNNQEKSLSINDKSNVDNEEKIKNLCESLKINTSITTLDLSKIQIGNNVEDHRFFNEAFKINTNITTLSLDDETREKFNYLKDLGKTLDNITYLKYAEIPKKYDHENMKYLCEALKINKSITTLYLSNNSIGENVENLLYLCEALKINKSITKLDLSNNSIGGNVNDLLYLCEALKINESITKLDLRNNSIGQNVDDMKYLYEALKFNTTITNLDLSNNSIGWNNVAQLLELFIKTNRSFSTYCYTEMNKLLFNKFNENSTKIEEILSKSGENFDLKNIQSFLKELNSLKNIFPYEYRKIYLKVRQIIDEKSDKIESIIEQLLNNKEESVNIKKLIDTIHFLHSCGWVKEYTYSIGSYLIPNNDYTKIIEKNLLYYITNVSISIKNINFSYKNEMRERNFNNIKVVYENFENLQRNIGNKYPRISTEIQEFLTNILDKLNKELSLIKLEYSENTIIDLVQDCMTKKFVKTHSIIKYLKVLEEKDLTNNSREVYLNCWSISNNLKIIYCN